MYEGLTGWRKIALSWPAMVLLYGVPFGLLQEYTVTQSNHRSFYGAMIIGIPFGALMTVFTRESSKRRMKAQGVKDPRQLQTLFKYVKNVEVPKDSKTKMKLDTYIDRQLRSNQRSKIWSTALFFVIGLANFIPALIDKNGKVLGIILSLFLFFMAIFTYTYSNKQLARLKELKSKLAKS
jgi:Flp pilus assembly protein TadB